MKILAIFTSCLILCSSVASAQTPSRDELINQIETIYARSTILSPDSPLIDMYLSTPKQANPNTSSETWATVKQEVAIAVTNVMTRKGGSMDLVLRKSLDALSDTELSRLIQLLNDPVFVKYQAAVNSPAAQKQMMQGMVGMALGLNAAINKVLVSHGLKEVH